LGGGAVYFSLRKGAAIKAEPGSSSICGKESVRCEKEPGSIGKGKKEGSPFGVEKRTPFQVSFIPGEKRGRDAG